MPVAWQTTFSPSIDFRGLGPQITWVHIYRRNLCKRNGLNHSRPAPLRNFGLRPEAGPRTILRSPPAPRPQPLRPPPSSSCGCSTRGSSSKPRPRASNGPDWSRKTRSLGGCSAKPVGKEDARRKPGTLSITLSAWREPARNNKGGFDHEDRSQFATDADLAHDRHPLGRGSCLLQQR